MYSTLPPQEHVDTGVTWQGRVACGTRNARKTQRKKEPHIKPPLSAGNQGINFGQEKRDGGSTSHGVTSNRSSHSTDKPVETGCSKADRGGYEKACKGWEREVKRKSTNRE